MIRAFISYCLVTVSIVPPRLQHHILIYQRLYNNEKAVEVAADKCSCFLENLLRCYRTVRHHVAVDNSLYRLIIKHTIGAKMVLH